ncbi:methyltransferase domain-containing protein [Rhodosalinus sediminis]|uniref:Methyltransferase domain-containing protein n=1 Tax=Rhodosalinus sediminis TaxID=1940533 RepID=A0A3D9BWC6_9RHOB|nr:methyltransferase [Rhodosalinus sediminis]REC57825.1 methyltransferase domain-containing protein [Rhodosalinus sediminis]
MAEVAGARPERPRRRDLPTALARLAARPGFQRWAAAFPLTRRLVRREGDALMDLVAGFVQAQALAALVELRVIETLLEGPQDAAALGRAHDIPVERMQALLQAGAAMGLLARRRGARFSVTARGAALTGVPGLLPMIRHHGAFYRDMGDPVALLRGEAETELAGVWPYVFGAREGIDPATARAYSDLMTQSQALVAEDTLRLVSLKGVARLLDVGGGTGAFLRAAAAKRPDLGLMLMDLPEVVEAAREQMAAAGLGDRATLHPGSFRDAPLPEGADAISLIRVLYDHEDATVRGLLAKCFAALPPGGRLIVSEPMSGGARPDRATDVYFAFYCMAMRTGRTRSAAEIAALLREAGFETPERENSLRPYVTTALVARKPLQSVVQG